MLVGITDAEGHKCQKNVAVTINAPVNLCADWNATAWGSPVGHDFTGSAVGVTNSLIVSYVNGAFNGLMEVDSTVVQAGGPCTCNLHVHLTGVGASQNINVQIRTSSFALIATFAYGTDFGPGIGDYDVQFPLASHDTYNIIVVTIGHPGDNTNYVLTFTNLP
jgi:hypothetical protein